MAESEVISGQLVGKIAPPERLFPMTIGFADATLKLHADGTIEGDIDSFRNELAHAEGGIGSGGMAGICTAVGWLVLQVAKLRADVARVSDDVWDLKP